VGSACEQSPKTYRYRKRFFSFRRSEREKPFIINITALFFERWRIDIALAHPIASAQKRFRGSTFKNVNTYWR